MSDADICVLGAAKVANGVALWQGVIPIANDNGENPGEPLGESDVYQALGLTSLPYPKDENGFAEAIALRNVGGRDVVYVGARDTRTAKIVGNAQPGDTIVHSTGPEQAAQLQLKEKKRQAVLATKDSQKRTMALVLDGKNDKVQLAALGALLEIDKNGDFSIVNAAGAGIRIEGNKIHLLGELALPGMREGFSLMQGLPAGQVAGPAAVLLLPVQAAGK
jgi:hypothetical protein